MWQAFYTKDSKHLRRKRKSAVGGEQSAPETKDQSVVRSPSSEPYDTMRRRSTNASLILTQTYSIDKFNNAYGSISSRKKSSLAPLVEGDV